jgi:cytidylate kinase
MPQTIRIAIDGYSSCGKSTLAKALAKRIDFTYIDSGAMYRCVTLYMLNHSIDTDDHAAVGEALEHIHIDMKKGRFFLNDEDVSEAIRNMVISENVSRVSAVKEVRKAMVKKQQRLGKNQNVVMDGRDIGTTVFPDAQLKVFMTAHPMIRAQRRYKELMEKGEEVSIEEVMANLNMRDYQDTHREESPLTQAEDAIVLDNSFLTPEEQLNYVLKLIHDRHLEVSYSEPAK